MKYLLIFITLLLLSCSQSTNRTVSKLDEDLTYHAGNIKIEKLSEQITHGLYKITVDDTVNILIYRGVESVTMIHIK